MLVSGSYGGYNITLNLSTGYQGNTSCKAVNEPAPYKPSISFYSKHCSGGTVAVTIIGGLTFDITRSISPISAVFAPAGPVNLTMMIFEEMRKVLPMPTNDLKDLCVGGGLHSN